MADNVAITAGSGTNIAADEATYSGDTTKVQLVKPVVVTGAEGSKTVLELTAASGGEQRVMGHRDLTRIAVDSGGLTTATTSYSGGDQVGSLFTLAGAARASGGTGLIVGCVLTDAANIIGSYDVVVFRASVTLASDNAAFAVSDADAKNIVAVIQLAGSILLGNNRVAHAYNLSIPYDCSGGTSLYAALMCRTTHTFFADVTDLQLQLFVERN